jgi:tight adherence protein B
MSALAVAAIAALGSFWLYTSLALGWTGFGFGPRVDGTARATRFDLDGWLRQAGLEDVDRREFAAVILMLFLLGFVGAFATFGGIGPAIVSAVFAASFPIASYRHRRETRRQRAQEAWPRMIEEIRVQTAALGRSIPQALFEVGGRGPVELRPAFEAAHREWLLTTDLPRTFTVLKTRLADPTADMACETLLIAHELGGSDLDRRLEALAEDRLEDVQSRKDARSRQAGARFARVFVLIVPAGMALAGISIGNGRASYRSGTGQLVVLAALGLVIGCWWWAGRVMRLPEPQRVFTD